MTESDPDKCARLIEHIVGLDKAHPNTLPVVQATRFFDGNADDYSMGANLEPILGIAAFRKAAELVAGRPDVSHVLVSVLNFDEYPNWPFAESFLVCTSAGKGEVESWFAHLQPDDVTEPSDRVVLPPPPRGHAWWCVWWD